jgi:hypothetical protein
MWDWRVVEKIEEFVGSLLFLVLSKMPKINLLGLLRVFMFLILIVIEGFYRLNWLICLACGTCHGASGEISTSLVFLVRDRVQPIFVHLWWSS